VVVAVGLTPVEPLADEDTNVPGVIAMLVASVVTQLNVVLAPALIPVGLATKEVIVGADCALFPEDKLEDPQPVSTMPASKPVDMMRNNGKFLRKEVSHSGIEESSAGDRSKEVILPT
jgi:hypothetical protein